MVTGHVTEANPSNAANSAQQRRPRSARRLVANCPDGEAQGKALVPALARACVRGGPTLSPAPFQAGFRARSARLAPRVVGAWRVCGERPHALRKPQRGGHMRRLCVALALLARAAAQITTASKGVGSGVCFVGPYGWSCDPDDFAFASTLAQTSSSAQAATSSSTVALVANAPSCSANCSDDCTPPCPPACASLKFEARPRPACTSGRAADWARPRRNGWRSCLQTRCSISSTHTTCAALQAARHHRTRSYAAAVRNAGQ